MLQGRLTNFPRICRGGAWNVREWCLPRQTRSWLNLLRTGVGQKAASCLAYCFKKYFRQSPNKALHWAAMPLRSIAAGELHVIRHEEEVTTDAQSHFSSSWDRACGIREEPRAPPRRNIRSHQPRSRCYSDFFGAENGGLRPLA